MQITDRDRFWMNNKVFQFFRFVVLNLKILKGRGRQQASLRPARRRSQTRGPPRGGPSSHRQGIMPGRAGSPPGAQVLPWPESNREESSMARTTTRTARGATRRPLWKKVSVVLSAPVAMVLAIELLHIEHLERRSSSSSCSSRSRWWPSGARPRLSACT